MNTTLIVQVAPTVTDAPQVLDYENCPGLLPESVMLVMGSATDPVFLTVINMGLLRSLTNWLPNANDVGDAV